MLTAGDRALLTTLNAEWEDLASGRFSGRLVARWARQHPVLAGYEDLHAVVAVQWPRRSGDDFMLALLDLAQTGHAVAARAVLQRMLPKAVKVAARSARDDALTVAVAALWERIVTYPIERRPTSVAANLAMDTMRAVFEHAEAESGEGRSVTADLDQDDQGAPRIREREPEIVGRQPEDHRAPDAEVYEVLAWGVEKRVITRDDAQLLLERHCIDASGRAATPTEVGRSRGMTAANVRQRCHRATRRLAVAVAGLPTDVGASVA